MTPLERHRFFLYGRAGLSIVLFLTSMIVGASTALTTGSSPLVWLVVGTLVGSVLILPRTFVPRNDEAREAASEEQLDHFRRMRRWLTWTRLAYLLVAIGVLVGLPELL